jgi:hypothetical protein
MKTLPLIQSLVVVSLSVMAMPAYSQSAEGFDTTGLAPARGTPAASAPAPEKRVETTPEAEAVLKLSSRYAGSGSDLAAYISTYSGRFSIKNRQTDPFGRFQNPDFKPAEPKIVSSKGRPSFKPAPPTPFVDVVSAIEVNTVDLAKQRFLVGTREFRKGSVFPVQLPNGKNIKIQVLSVSSTVIRFRNLETGETADRKLEMLPPGMSKGGHPRVAPGMQSTSPDAPLLIQPGPPPLSSN